MIQDTAAPKPTGFWASCLALRISFAASRSARAIEKSFIFSNRAARASTIWAQRNPTGEALIFAFMINSDQVLNSLNAQKVAHRALPGTPWSIQLHLSHVPSWNKRLPTGLAVKGGSKGFEKDRAEGTYSRGGIAGSRRCKSSEHGGVPPGDIPAFDVPLSRQRRWSRRQSIRQTANSCPRTRSPLAIPSSRKTPTNKGPVGK